MNHPIYFARHGETEWNLAGRFQGRLDSPLTERGQAQAGVVSRILAREIDRPEAFDFVASPLGRTLQTARIAFAPFGTDARHDDRLAEISVGKWSGMTFDEISAEYPDIAKLSGEPFWEFRAPGGETLDQALQRAADWLSSISTPTVAISHGVIGRLIRGTFLGVSPREAMDLQEPQGVVIRLKDGVEDHLTLAENG